MYSMEVVVLEHKWPRLQLMIKLPDNTVMEAFSHYDIAASQFEPQVKQALSKLVDQVLIRKGIKPKK